MRKSGIIRLTLGPDNLNFFPGTFELTIRSTLSMKPVGCFSKLVAGGVALAALLAVSSAQAATGRAVVRGVTGTASYSEQGGEWKPLKSGQSLSPGATVRTGVDGSVD